MRLAEMIKEYLYETIVDRVKVEKGDVSLNSTKEGGQLVFTLDQQCKFWLSAKALFSVDDDLLCH